MTSDEIAAQLQPVASAGDDVWRLTYVLTEAWSAEYVGVECVEPILRFMEEYPDLDYGTPGPLVHFIEQFYPQEYEEKLFASVGRRPTFMTVWMVARLLNTTEEPAERRLLLQVLAQATIHPQVDQGTLERIRDYLAQEPPP